MNDNVDNDPRLHAIPDIHGHAKGEHKAFTDERPIPLSARMLFLWFYHACRRGWPRFLMVTDHMNYLTFEDPAAINLVRRALKLAQAGDLYGAAETASVEVGHAAVVSEGLRRGMRYSLGAEVDNDPRSRPDAQNIVDAMKPDGMIRSVHFLTIDHPTHGPNWNWPFDNPEFADVYETVGTEKTWELYMATLLDAVERLPGNIVGHFYVPANFGHWPDDATLEAYEDRLVDACEARGMAVEFNTRFLYRDHSDEQRAKYLAAHRRLLAKCKAKNVGIAVGSDAHSPKDQGHAFGAVLALLDECEINELVFPIAGRLARVALRIERKAEPPPVIPEPASAAAVDDRKAPRKARTSETPTRAKDSSPKREEPVPSDEVAASDGEDAAPVGKARSRPKRSKSKATPAVDVRATESPEDGTPSGAAEPAESAADGHTPDAEPVRDTAGTVADDKQLDHSPAAKAVADEPTDVAPSDAETFVDEVTYEGVTELVQGPEVGDSLVESDDMPADAAAAVLIREAEGDVDDHDAAQSVAPVLVRKSRPKAAPKTKIAAPVGKAKAPAGKAKPAAKKAAAAAVKGPPKNGKKSGAKKAVVKKAPVKKTPAAAIKKAAAKKAPVAKRAAVRGNSLKKAGPKKAAAKKAGVKKPAPKRR